VSQPRRVVFWRHGRTDWNASSRFQGQSDSMLDEVGIKQAAAAALQLARLDPAFIMSSDLQRAHDTALPLADALGLDVVLDEGLRETFVGVWQGMFRADIEREHTKDLQEWIAGTNIRPGLHGETRTEVAARVSAAVNRGLAQIGPGQTLVCVTHGAAAMSGIAALLDLPLEKWPIFAVMPNCAWSIAVETQTPTGPAWRIQEYNTRVPEL
jgi:broad specificity phosphatase PhoE